MLMGLTVWYMLCLIAQATPEERGVNRVSENTKFLFNDNVNKYHAQNGYRQLFTRNQRIINYPHINKACTQI